jgi:hypothetical protein
MPATNLSWHVADNHNLRYVSCNAWEFILNEELSERKIMYLGKNRNRKVLGTQQITMQLDIFFFGHSETERGNSFEILEDIYLRRAALLSYFLPQKCAKIVSSGLNRKWNF